MKALLPACLATLLLAAGSAWGADQIRLTADSPGAGIESLAVSGAAGEMRVVPSPDDKVHVRLTLEQQQHSFLWLFHWMSGDTTRDLAAAALKEDRHGSSLAVSLVYPSGGTHSDVQEKWTVSVPAKFLVDAELQEGEIAIEGMRGGVKSHLDAGEIVIQGTAGGVQASVTYGRLHMVTDDTQPGIITVSSGHGLAAMVWNGKYYGPPEEQGFMSHIHLLGNTLAERGGGGDNIDLSVHFGEVDLRIGQLGGVQDYKDLFKTEKLSKVE